MSKTQIPTGGIADDAISEEHLDATAITGHTALAATPADTDEFLISDGGVLKRLDASYIGGNNTPAFFVRNSANQDVSHGSETLVTWGTEILDTDNAFASNKFTPQEAGKYFIAFQLGGSDDSATSSNLAYLALKIRKNGSSYESQGIFNLNNNQGRQATYSIQAIVDLNGSSDYVDFSAEVGTADSSTARFIDDYARASGFKLIGA
jgi:hypothetical protein|tara:strand:+ start:1779 stop:2399 length:621 start_codon:yes stop_codon:yes gene_type:complete